MPPKKINNFSLWYPQQIQVYVSRIPETSWIINILAKIIAIEKKKIEKEIQ